MAVFHLSCLQPGKLPGIWLVSLSLDRTILRRQAERSATVGHSYQDPRSGVCIIRQGTYRREANGLDDCGGHGREHSVLFLPQPAADQASGVSQPDLR